MIDIAETIHRKVYGKSGRANANTDPNFLAGFKAGAEREDHLTAMHEEWERRGYDGLDILKPEWKEWKRGLYAARLQKAFARQG